MRLSAVFSALFHVAILVAAMTTLANPNRFDVETPVNIPVELLTIDEFTNISAAITEEDVIEEPVEEEVVEEAPPPEPEPVRTASLPEPEPVLPEIEPEFSPFEEPEPEPVVAEPEPEPASVPDLAEARPRMRPEPPRRDEFDFGEAAALIDLTPQEEPEPEFDLEGFEIGAAQPEVADEARSRVGVGTGLTMSETDALRAQITQCWNVPAGAMDAENLIIELRLFLNPDGTVQRVERLNLLRYGSDGFYRAAVDSAVRAVERCETGTNFDGSFRRGYNLPLDRYEEWRSIRLTFDPSDML